jgi:hypothetical protein
MTPEEFQQVFGPWTDWLQTASEAKNAPLDFVALALLTTASACIGNTRWARPWDGWKEPPILWSMLVGDPSAGKSPALDSILDPVKEIEREMSEAYKTARKEWEDADQIASLVLSQWKSDAKSALAEGSDAPAKPVEADAGKRPIRARVQISDATTEKVADLLANTWRGLLLSRDELSGWLGGMDRYSGGGDRPFWLEAFGGRSYTIDRKNSPEPVIVDHLSVSILGGTQPDKLDSLLVKSDDDGMLARFLVAHPEPLPVTRPAVAIDEPRMIAAIKALLALKPHTDDEGNKRPLFIDLTDEAADILQAFRKQCREWERDAEGPYKGHIGKLPGLAVRTALVLAHLDYAANPEAGIPANVTRNHIGRACHLVGGHFREHAFRAYGMAKPAPEILSASALAELITSQGLKAFKVRDIQNRQRKHLAKGKEIMSAIRILQDAFWLSEQKVATGGRPSVVFGVNPKLEELQ